METDISVPDVEVRHYVMRVLEFLSSINLESFDRPSIFLYLYLRFFSCSKQNTE